MDSLFCLDIKSYITSHIRISEEIHQMMKNTKVTDDTKLPEGQGRMVPWSDCPGNKMSGYPT